MLIAALPGLALMALSLLAFLVSLFALLLLTVPVYSALKGLTGGRAIEPTATIEPFAGGRRSKTVDSTVVD